MNHLLLKAILKFCTDKKLFKYMIDWVGYFFMTQLLKKSRVMKKYNLPSKFEFESKSFLV